MGFFDSINSDKAGSHLLNLVQPIPESLRLRTIENIRKTAGDRDCDDVLDMLGLLDDPTD